jgi:hypothetical protein
MGAAETRPFCFATEVHGLGGASWNGTRGGVVKFCGAGVDVVKFTSDRSEECEQSSVVKCGSW